jgi:hypothetical protein
MPVGLENVSLDTAYGRDDTKGMRSLGALRECAVQTKVECVAVHRERNGGPVSQAAGRCDPGFCG